MALLPPFYPPHHFSGVPRPMKSFLMGAPEEYRLLRFVMNNPAAVSATAIPRHVQALVDNFGLTPVVVDQNPNVSTTFYEYRLTPRDGYSFEAFLAQIDNVIARARELENLGGYKVYVIEPQAAGGGGGGGGGDANITNTTNPPAGGGSGTQNPQTPGTPESDNTAIIVLAVLAITGIGALLILNRNK